MRGFAVHGTGHDLIPILVPLRAPPKPLGRHIMPHGANVGLIRLTLAMLPGSLGRCPIQQPLGVARPNVSVELHRTTFLLAGEGAKQRRLSQFCTSATGISNSALASNCRGYTHDALKSMIAITCWAVLQLSIRKPRFPPAKWTSLVSLANGKMGRRRPRGVSIHQGVLCGSVEKHLQCRMQRSTPHADSKASFLIMI